MKSDVGVLREGGMMKEGVQQKDVKTILTAQSQYLEAETGNDMHSNTASHTLKVLMAT